MMTTPDTTMIDLEAATREVSLLQEKVNNLQQRMATVEAARAENAQARRELEGRRHTLLEASLEGKTVDRELDAVRKEILEREQKDTEHEELLRLLRGQLGEAGRHLAEARQAEQAALEREQHAEALRKCASCNATARLYEQQWRELVALGTQDPAVARWMDQARNELRNRLLTFDTSGNVRLPEIGTARYL